MALDASRTPQQNLDPGHQLGKGKGLHQVVVGAALEAADTIFHLAPRGEHQYRRLLALTQCSQYGQAVDTRQHAVQNQQVVVDLGGHVQTVDAGMGHIDGVAFLAQALT